MRLQQPDTLRAAGVPHCKDEGTLTFVVLD
jgi:hypothetical protein